MGTPLVTVLMPAYNAAPYLGPAIDSVVTQTLADFELLVVDDGSTDGSREVVRGRRDSRIRLLENGRNLGLTRSLNRGLREARAGLVARQDADDLSEPTRLERQARFLAGRPDVALLGAQARVIDSRGHTAGSIARACSDDAIRWEMLFENAFVHSSVMFRREVVLGALRGYDERFAYCQDYELWSRLLRAHRAANLDRRLVRCRAHGASMTETGGAANARESAEVLTAQLRATFGDELSNAEIALALKLRIGLEALEVAPFLALLERLLTAYQQRVPGIEASADFRRSVARIASVALRRARYRGAALLGLILRLEKRGYPLLGETMRYVASRLMGRTQEALTS